jgi:hypothetical protein
MSNTKSFMKSKAAGGAALVALSGFIPQPLVTNHAQAASAKISVKGSFISGIKISAIKDAVFGSNIATAANGKLVLSSANVVTPSKGVHIGGSPASGQFKFTAASTTPSVDITVAGLGAMTLGATAGGVAAVGTAKLAKITLDKIGATATLTDGGGGTAKSANYDITATKATIQVGGEVTWGATPPIGAFAEEITLTIAY